MTEFVRRFVRPRFSHFTHTSRLLVIDTGTHLRRIRDLLMQTGFARRDMSSTVYQLHHAKSELVAKVIQEFLAAGAQDGGAAHSPSLAEGGYLGRSRLQFAPVPQ